MRLFLSFISRPVSYTHLDAYKRQAKEREHLLQGLLIAQDNIDEVIHIIRTSYDNAKENLMQRFGLDEVQAQALSLIHI